MSAVKPATTVSTSDGKRFRVGGAEIPFIGAWSNIFYLSAPGFYVRAHSTAKGGSELGFELVGSRPGEREEFEAADMTIFIHNLDDGQSTVVTAAGPYHEVSVGLPGRGIQPKDVLAVLAHFDAVDSPYGITIIPKVRLGAKVEHLASTVGLLDLGGLTVTPAGRMGRDSFPNGTGKQVPGGEVWANHIRGSNGGFASGAFVLRNDYWVSELTFDANAPGRLSQAQHLVESLIVEAA